MTDTINTEGSTTIATVPTIPSEMTEGEGRELLTRFQDLAANEIRRSTQALTVGIMHLNTIREHRLFTYGGYQDWGAYLADFKDQQGFGRATIYGNLKVLRLMMGGLGLNEETVLLFGVPRLRPITDVIKDYNRETGEIESLANGVADKLLSLGLPGETDGERLGHWVEANLDPETDTVSTIHDLLDSELPHKVKYRWFPVTLQDGTVTDVSWEAVHPDKDSEQGYSLTEMPKHVQHAFFKRIGYKGEC